MKSRFAVIIVERIMHLFFSRGQGGNKPKIQVQLPVHNFIDYILLSKYYIEKYQIIIKLKIKDKH